MKNSIFEPFSKTSSGRRAATLMATHTNTTAQLFKAVRTDVAAALPGLIEGKKYSTEKLCSLDTWSPLYKAERRVAGMILAYLVKVGAIPLTLHRTRKGKGTKRYRLPFVQVGVAPLPTCLAVNGPCQLPSVCSPLNITVGEQ
jgi:hypothetical protein